MTVLTLHSIHPHSILLTSWGWGRTSWGWGRTSWGWGRTRCLPFGHRRFRGCRRSSSHGRFGGHWFRASLVVVALWLELSGFEAVLDIRPLRHVGAVRGTAVIVSLVRITDQLVLLPSHHLPLAAVHVPLHGGLTADKGRQDLADDERFYHHSQLDPKLWLRSWFIYLSSYSISRTGVTLIWKKLHLSTLSLLYFIDYY